VAEVLLPGMTAADFNEEAFKDSVATSYSLPSPDLVTLLDHNPSRRRLNTGDYRVKYEIAMTQDADSAAIVQEMETKEIEYIHGSFSTKAMSNVLSSPASESSSNTGLIVGVVVGVLVGLPLLVFGVFSVMYKTSPDKLPDSAKNKLGFLGAPGPSRQSAQSSSSKKAAGFEMTDTASETQSIADKPTEVERGLSEREIISPRV